MERLVGVEAVDDQRDTTFPDGVQYVLQRQDVGVVEHLESAADHACGIAETPGRRDVTAVEIDDPIESVAGSDASKGRCEQSVVNAIVVAAEQHIERIASD